MDIRQICSELDRTYRPDGEADRLALYRRIEDPNGLYRDEPVLFFAAAHADAQAVEWLLGAGADGAARTERGKTALHALAEGADREQRWPDADAARCGTLLLEAGASPLRKDSSGKSAVLAAAEWGCDGLVAALIAAGKKLDLANDRGDTALHLACDQAVRAAESFHTYVKPQYERFLAEPAPRNDLEQKVLEARLGPAKEQFEREEARVESYVRTVRLLIEAGLDPEAKNNHGKTPKEMILPCADLRIPALLNGEPVEGEAADPLRLRAKGMTPMQAVLLRDHDALEAALQLGADPNEPSDEAVSSPSLPAGITPLGAACSLLDARAAALLLAHGADPGLRDNAGWIPAAHAFTTTASLHTNHNVFRDKVVDSLLQGMVDHGLDLNASADDAGNTLLGLACAKLDAATGYNSDTLPGRFLTVLLRLGADPNPANYAGVTPLMPVCAGQSSYMEDAQLSLLEAGAEVGAQDGEGNTPLHWTMRNRNPAMARTMAAMLFEFGDPQLRAVNNAGKTALELAAETGNEQLVADLLARL